MKTPEKKLTMTAVLFRNIFIGLLALSLTIGIALASLGIKQLQSTADTVQTVVNEADTIDQTNNRTTVLWNELQQNQQVVKRAGQVVAESKSYAYQDVIVRDLRNFAQKADITITDYDFTISSSAASTTTTQPEPAAPEGTGNSGAVSNGAAGGAPAAEASTLKTTSVTVTVATPVNYKNLLRFIHYIEQNLTKMQISKVSLSRIANENPNTVNSDALTIEVYIQ